MATIVSTLYPPLIETFMPAFPFEGPAPVTFSFSPYNNMSDIKKIHISLVNQYTNEPAFESSYTALDDTNTYALINSIWIIPFSVNGNNFLTVDTANNSCTVNIPRDLLKSENFITSNYYKVQIRFDSSSVSLRNDVGRLSIDTSYLVNNRQYFSEWSSVCLIKAIPEIQLGMTDFDSEYTDVTNSNTISTVRKVQIGIVPISGRVFFIYENNDKISTKDQETLQRYKISIKSEDRTETLDETEWIYTSNNIDPNKIYWLADITNAVQDTVYDVIIELYTKNQYYFTKTYQIKTSAFDVTSFTPVFTFKKIVQSEFEKIAEEEFISDYDADSRVVTEEDGMINFTITAAEDLPQGFLYVKRASSLDNFKKWELISCTQNIGTINKSFTDRTVGSLVKYRYACQYRIKKNNMWTKSYFSEYIYPIFHDILITKQDRQLAIRYNGQISNYTPVVNRQVINTLGGKYPKFAENARMNYKKFMLTGLISAEADFNRKFINDRNYADEMNDYDRYMDGEYEVRNDTVSDGELTYNNVSQVNYPDTHSKTNHLINNTLHDLYPKDNWWLEREFREQAIEWLNDGEPKLFRSMTEGNMAIMLTDVSLTPNPQVGRRIYNISMTVYEIEDGYSLDVLSSLGIVNVPDEYSDYINAGAADSSDDSDSSDNRITETVIGQMYQKTGDGSGLIYNDIDLVDRVDSLDDYTVDDYWNSLYYQGALSNYMVIPESYKLKDLKIQFETKPQWYDLDNLNLTTTGDNLGLGYKIGLILYDEIKKKNLNSEPMTIFIGEKGYYQIPSNLSVTNIILYDNAKATLDYKLTYQRQYNENSIPTEVEIAQKIVGQIDGRWNPQEGIAEQIKNKYEYYKILPKDQKGGYNGLLEKQYLNDITAFGFDGTSYATLQVLFKDSDKVQEFIVGRTGVYNLMTDYPIEEVYFSGRRMFRKDNENYNSYIPNPYTLDVSTTAYQAAPINNFNWINIDSGQITDVLIIINDHISSPERNEIVRNFTSIDTEDAYNDISEILNPVANTVYGVYKNNDVVLMLYLSNGRWEEIQFINAGDGVIMNVHYNTDPIPTGKKRYFLDEWKFSLDNSANQDYSEEKLYWYKAFLGSTKNQVSINSSTNINNHISKIGEDIYIPAIDGYNSIEDIKNPDYNVVYGIKNGNSKIYKIYYIDQQWYDVDFITGNQSLILAKVPVYGMVNYRGTLVKIRYE